MHTHSTSQMHTHTHTHTHSYILITHTHTHIHTHAHLTDLTAQHNAHMLTCDFTPQNTTTTSSTPSSPTPPHPAEPATNENNQQTGTQPNSGANENGRQIPSEQKSFSGSSTPRRGFVYRKLSLTVTCFAWLPALVKTELNEKATSLALVAMATRLGHVILMGVEVPLDSGW